MEETNKCPKCNGEMENGLLVGEGGYWRPDKSVLNILRPPNVFGATKVTAYKCPKCGKIELTSDVQK